MKRFFRSRSRRILASLAALALVVVAGLAAASLLTAASAEPSAQEEGQIRDSIDRWLSLDDVSWPTDSFGSKTLPPGFVAQERAHDKQIYSQVATDAFAARESDTAMVDVIQMTREATDQVIYASEHKILDFSYIGYEDVGKQVYRVRFWTGDTRGKWNADEKTMVDVRKVDNIITYKVTLVQIDDVWMIDDVSVIDSTEDTSPDQYGPDTPHATNSAQAVDAGVM
jgi:hypothetical protein